MTSLLSPLPSLLATPSRKLKATLLLFNLGIWAILLVNSLLPMLDTAKELWLYPDIIPYIKPIGTDFREGYYYPSKVLLEGKSPYVDYNLNYPPFSAVFSIPFTLLDVDTAYLVAACLIFALNIGSVGLGLSIARRVFTPSPGKAGTNEELSLSPITVHATLVAQMAAFGVTSYGFLFSVERGNLDAFPLFFSLLALWLLARSTASAKELWVSTLLIGIAAHLKIYPAALFVLVAWKYGRKSLLPILLVNIVLFFCAGIPQAVQFFQQIVTYSANPFIWVGNHSAVSFAHYVNSYLGEHLGIQLPSLLFYLLPVALWTLGIWKLWRKGFSPANLTWLYLLTVPLLCLIPSVSHDYKLVIHTPAFAMLLYWLLAGPWAGQIRQFVGLLILLALLFLIGRSPVLLPTLLKNKYPFILAFQFIILLGLFKPGPNQPDMGKSIPTMTSSHAIPQLKIFPTSEYVGVNRDDPIRFYHTPIFGSLYRRRVELCLAELNGGERVLEVGFGSGVTFLNLHDQYPEIHGLDLTAEVDAVSAFFRQKGIETDLRNGSVLEMSYTDNTFDSVLLISILEHLQPGEQAKAFTEITRVLRPGGQVVYGVPIERPLMVFFFRLLGYNIRLHHFSTHDNVRQAAAQTLHELRIVNMPGPFGLFGGLYQIGNFTKPTPE